MQGIVQANVSLLPLKLSTALRQEKSLPSSAEHLMALFVSPFSFIESSRNTVTMFDILENFGKLRHSAPLQRPQ